jgi:hypothetical protein
MTWKVMTRLYHCINGRFLTHFDVAHAYIAFLAVAHRGRQGNILHLA